MQKKIDFVPMKTFREELLAVKLWFGLACVFVKHRVHNKVLFLLGEKRVSPRVKKIH